VKIELNRDWTEFLSALIARRVRFVLVGGHAVAGHGQPRLTEDLDVFVEPTPANARRLREALVAFGFRAVAPSVEELARKDRVFMLGRKPWRIDVLTGIDGVSFREAWAGRVEAEFVSTPLFVIGRAALLKNKRAAGRAKDLLDVALLEESKPSRRQRTTGARRPTGPSR
jgi:nucleotidyltransferase AbiEii toxin of type IV toxin-antitoxin system